MEKKLVAAVIVAICVVVAVGGALAYQAVSAPEVPETKTPMVASAPFNVVFKWGSGAKNELNTYNSSITKDLVINGTVTTTLVLSKEELDGLQQKIIEMNLFDYPDSFPDSTIRRMTPQGDYYIEVQNGNVTKQVSWNSNSEVPSSMQEDLDTLREYITTLVKQTPEYQALPEAVGAYL